VLFADLIDSTALTRQLDAERVREVLAAFYGAVSEELSASRGKAEKYIGDAVMAVFGLPQAHENDAVRAVRAGLAIRARARRLDESSRLGGSVLEVRVGVEARDVAVRPETARQGLVTGPAVNAAARLQAAAGPGEILVGEVAYSLTAGAVVFGERREVSAKGFAEPLFPSQQPSLKAHTRGVSS
jgi:class 3 adenylate cyclase